MRQEESDKRTASEEELFEIIDRTHTSYKGEGVLDVSVSSYWEGATRWARNRIGMSVNRTDTLMSISLGIDGGHGNILMNPTDDESIRNALDFCEWKAHAERQQGFPDDSPLPLPELKDPEAVVWSDATSNYSFLDSGDTVRKTCLTAEGMNLVAAGYINCTTGSTAYSSYNRRTHRRERRYVKLSKGQCSITARSLKGTGSGWGGASDVDFNKINTDALAAKAFDKCLASMDPVRVEPGRYTAILEPQAVSDLVSRLLFANGLVMNREGAENPVAPGHGPHPFTLTYDPSSGLILSKLGLKIFDERLTVWHDPLDPELGVVGHDPKYIGVEPITYVKDGVLTALPHDGIYGANRLEISNRHFHRSSFRMSGGTSSVDDMISTTKRGILVTRFSGGGVTNASALVATGLTRDGLWLIENGKIKHALRNFKTLESPFFALNNIEELGVPTKVFSESPEALPPGWLLSFSPLNFAPQFIVPALKIKDFSFAATIDAV